MHFKSEHLIATVFISVISMKCICQTLNKFGTFIANLNLRLITDSLKFSCSVIW